MNDILNVVYLIDDDEALCKAIQWLLEPANLQVKIFHSAFAFLETYNSNLRGCLLIDVRMPGMSGLQLQEQLISMGNLMPIIMLSGHGDIAMAVRALKAGAIDFITKPFNDQSLLEQIQNALLKDKSKDNIANIWKRYKMLSEREQEVMLKISAGKMNKVIAHELNISAKTVEVHRASIMQKMQAKSLAELVKMDCMMKMNNTFL
jgi:two-component system response regulator FixJ